MKLPTWVATERCRMLCRFIAETVFWAALFSFFLWRWSHS